MYIKNKLLRCIAAVLAGGLTASGFMLATPYLLFQHCTVLFEYNPSWPLLAFYTVITAGIYWDSFAKIRHGVIEKRSAC